MVRSPERSAYCPGMPDWLPKAVFVAGAVALVAIRAPHGQRSRSVRTIVDRKGMLERVLLAGAMIAFFLPFAWIFTDGLAFADYRARTVSFASGAVCLVLGLWAFHRSHVDLGRNWSISLEVREGHELVTRGVYARVRHPMYAALLLYSLGNALVVPNWLAGPSYAVSMLLVFAFRLAPEENLMRERFGAEYDAYRARTKRLIPFVW